MLQIQFRNCHQLMYTCVVWFFHALFHAGFVLDNEDRSVTRSDTYFKELFSQCGLYVYRIKVN